MNVLKNYLGACLPSSKIQDASSKVDKCEMHTCLRYPMKLCRWVGYFPVEGLNELTISKIRYNLKGLYLIYYALTVLTGIASAIIISLWLFEHSLSIFVVADFIFYATGSISMVLMARLAIQWPEFTKKVTEIEQHLQEIRTSKNTHKYCNIMTCAVMIMATVEHLLAVSYVVTVSVQCSKAETLSERVDNYFKYNLPYYFNYVPYNIFFAVVFKLVNCQCTFLWSFTDVLTICFSIYLISYFQDLNKVIFSRQNKLPWAQLRAYYSRVVELVLQVDHQLSGFILQSFVTYIFYICLQLFYILNKTHAERMGCDQEVVYKLRKSAVYLSYYAFSFLFLVVRFVVTSILAANVNLVAKKPLIALNAVPSAEYSLDVRRFRLQIEYAPVAMSGLFFYVTRPMLLKVVGSIITYELVMLQLH